MNRFPRKFLSRVAVATIVLFAVCSASSCTIGPHSLLEIPSVVLRIPLLQNGVATPYDWAINLCSNAENLCPNGTTPCFKGGFVVQYNSKTCATEPYDVFVKSAVSNETSGSLLFGRSTNPGWGAQVELSCGPTLIPQATQYVTVSGQLDVETFRIALSTSAMCAADSK